MAINGLFKNGVIKPLEPMNIPEDTVISFELISQEKSIAQRLSEEWSLHLVESISDDFEEPIPFFEDDGV